MSNYSKLFFVAIISIELRGRKFFNLIGFKSIYCYLDKLEILDIEPNSNEFNTDSSNLFCSWAILFYKVD